MPKKFLAEIAESNESFRVRMGVKNCRRHAGYFFGESGQGPERGVNSQRSLLGYVIQFQYGFPWARNDPSC